jgi:large subunit ribosomal protein L6
MSKVGKRIIDIPESVTVTINGQDITIKGPLGELKRTIDPSITAHYADGQLTVTRANELKFTKSIHGTTNALLQGMVTGVETGFSKTLVIVGVGYNVKMNGSALQFSLGLSHKIDLEIPSNLKVVIETPTELVISGIDKQFVGEYAAKIRAYRKPEPYGGKGIAYKGEYIRRKVGKAAA